MDQIIECQNCKSKWKIDLEEDILKILNAELAECPLCQIEEEEDEEEKQGQKKHRKRRAGTVLRKYPEEMADFIKINMVDMKNPELSEAINKKFDVDITPSRLASFMNYNDLKRNPIKKKLKSNSKPKEIINNSHRPERSKSGKIKSSRKKLFSEEVDGFIERHWKQNKDSNLRQLIGDKFDVWYTMDQIKAHRRMIGCVSNKPGRKVIEKEKNNLKEQEESYDDSDMGELVDVLDDN